MRQIVAYKRFFLDFYEKQNATVQEKIEWTLSLIEDLEIVPTKYFKHVEGKLYEVRVQAGNNIYRIFSFFDHSNLVVLASAIQKKTQKLHRKEIELTMRIMEEYFN